MEENNYCPIRNKDNICEATKELCDRLHCVERIRKVGTSLMNKKYEFWRQHRRGDERL